ncbi:PspA/IM30 family protein [Salipaludibacillus aurantiacus]|uniref:Phage shock protein A n=1 Tax=Salipaludibacillus aurantiacus TaxID=1601833 RepID=A0A1H9T691_9BACI|nr:PspA/IM30 family protein [Salipaludibacillus aurantiacus]SER92093.1 Phage shock protein A [Salipaludibacillus aurantiacus]
MANVFTRLMDSIEGDIQAFLDKKDEKNPMQALNHYLRQSEKETEKVRQLIERQRRLKDEFSSERKEADLMADKRRDQAEIAEKAGEHELADYARKDYEEYRARAERLTYSEIEAMRQLEALEKKYEEMNHKLKDMRLRRMEMMGRENVARARHQISKLDTGAGEKPYSRFADMERYIEELEHKVNNDYYRHTFDSKIARIEKQINSGGASSESNEKMV